MLTIATKREDVFSLMLKMPAGTWTGLTGVCHVKASVLPVDDATILHQWDEASVAVGVDGFTYVTFYAAGSVTKDWAPGDYVLDAKLEIPGTWGPFSTENVLLKVLPNVSQTEA